jgi:anti-sigma factor RsiW
MSTPGHPAERLSDLLDDRLTAPQADEVRRHVAGCAECRRELDWLAAGRAAARAARQAGPDAADLKSRVTEALDAVDRETARAPRPQMPGRWLWAGLAAAAVVALYLAGPWRSTAPDRVAVAQADFTALRSGALALELRSSDAAALERYFNESARGLRVRVIDLGMMGWALEGGLRREVGNQPAALYAYRSDAGAQLICEMYPGRLDDLPDTGDIRRRPGFEFRVYGRGGVTLVFWQEGELVCVLASDRPREEVVALAVAKAMAPA